MIRSLRSHIGLLAFAALTSGTAFGQLPVSRTAGVLDVSLPVNQTTLMALPLVEIVASGTVSAVAGTTYTLSSSPASLPDVLTTPHAIKITSQVNQAGTNAYGISAQITAQSGQDVTAALGTAPNVGDEFVVYQLETIGSIFGATNTAGLLGGSTSGAADIIYLESGGTLTAYFYKNGGLGGTGWRLVSAPTGSNQDGVVIGVAKGILVQRKSGGSAVSIRFTGDSMVANEKAVVATGFNIINNPFAVGATLDSSLLKDFVTGGSTSGAADIVYLESGGVLTAYFYKNGGLGGTGWRLVSAPTGANQGAVALTSGKAILFKEQAGTAGLTLIEPFAE
jgi:hypothetical protein